MMLWNIFQNDFLATHLSQEWKMNELCFGSDKLNICACLYKIHFHGVHYAREKENKNCCLPITKYIEHTTHYSLRGYGI